MSVDIGPAAPIEILNGTLIGGGNLTVTGPVDQSLVIMSIGGYVMAGTSQALFIIDIDGNAVYGTTANNPGFAVQIVNFAVWHPVAPGQVVTATLSDLGTGDAAASFAIGGITCCPFGV